MICAPFIFARRGGRRLFNGALTFATQVMGAGEIVNEEVAPRPSIHSLDDHVAQTGSTLTAWLPHWVPSSMGLLVQAERALFENVRTAIRGRYVAIDDGRASIWTTSLNEQDSEHQYAANNGKQYPLVLVHGFAGGVGIWTQNLDSLAQARTVHAFDLLGFGRSSRVKFSSDATLAELRWVRSIEQWRQEMRIEKMILCGHSLGGFVSAAYALQYPDRVRHLVLVDPWGMSDRGAVDAGGEREFRLPVWVRTLARVMSLFNPLATVRAAGPWGHHLVRKVRPDLGRRFGNEAIYDYIYHANAAASPTGESAFSSVSQMFGWARRPMGERLTALDQRVPLTFIFGQKSWIDSNVGFELVNRLPDNYVNVETIKGAGHHVYADEPTAFNECVNDTCKMVDGNDDRFAV